MSFLFEKMLSDFNLCDYSQSWEPSLWMNKLHPIYSYQFSSAWYPVCWIFPEYLHFELSCFCSRCLKCFSCIETYLHVSFCSFHLYAKCFVKFIENIFELVFPGFLLDFDLIFYLFCLFIINILLELNFQFFSDFLAFNKFSIQATMCFEIDLIGKLNLAILILSNFKAS